MLSNNLRNVRTVRARMHSMDWALENIGAGSDGFFFVEDIMRKSTYLKLAGKVIELHVDENERYTTQMFDDSTRYVTIQEIEKSFIEKIVNPEDDPEYFI